MRLLRKWFGIWTTTVGVILAGLLITGCQSTNDTGGQGNGGYSSAQSPPANATPGETTDARQLLGISDRQSEVLQVGDEVTVVFSDLPTPVQPSEVRIKDDGTITLLMNQTFTAAGKRRGDLEKEIRERYVPRFYLNLTVTLKQQERFYFVGGEVKAPGRFQYLGEITVSKAIQSAGDFTDFANKKKVRLTRLGGQIIFVNCVKALDNPQLDPPVYPGDKIHVKRRIW